MEKFKYQVSVIVPIYNAEDYLRECLDSLVMQTISGDKMEVLLINDGSTDKSLDICKEYAKEYDFFRVIDKKNEGVSITRNLGIRMAMGKYIMYLDSDDEFSQNVVQEVVNFFERNYEKIDLVTYPEFTYTRDGIKKAPHIRYKTLNKTGIYDLEREIFIFQARLNIAVKNEFSNNILFDEKLGYHEDQKYCSDILKRKLKIGFVKECEYKYKLHTGSIIAENTNPIVLFEPTTLMWEELFASFEEEVPEYYQALYVHDLSWKLSQNCLLPYHYSTPHFINSTERLWKLLDRVSEDVILRHPSVDDFHKYYFLQKKANNITPVVQNNNYTLLSKGKIVLERNSFELVFNKLREKEGKLLLLCTLKSQFFNFHEKPDIYVIENDINEKKLDTFLSSRSYYKCKTVTNNFWAFYYECDMSKIKAFKFEIEVDGIRFPTHYYKMETCPFVLLGKIVRSNYIVAFKDNVFTIEESFEKAIANQLEENDLLIKKIDENAYKIRKLSQRYVNREIWLYYDCKGVRYDNAYLQFIHDFKKNDDVDRYYILNNDYEDSKNLFSPEQLKYVVLFGTELHKQLFIRANKIISAYIEEVNLYPFPAENKKKFMDVMNMEIIYLQHGILHATLPWKYTPEKLEVDKVVVSSYFEKHNFCEKYGFRKQDILSVGMPRFEELDLSVKPTNRILYAPSWRMYLIGQCIDTVWELTEEKFIKSKYFIEIEKFLNSPKLHRLLEQNNMYLDFKIHPIFVPYLKYFSVSSEYINITTESIRDECYSIFITDFSSYTFNFAYIQRPIIYFVPDILEFKAGLNQYRELDIPFEEAFGDFAETIDETIGSLEKILKNNLEIEEKYKKRMENFFIPIDKCTEKLYTSIIQ